MVDHGTTIAETITVTHSEKFAKNSIKPWQEIQILAKNLKTNCYSPSR